MSYFFSKKISEVFFFIFLAPAGGSNSAGSYPAPILTLQGSSNPNYNSLKTNYYTYITQWFIFAFCCCCNNPFFLLDNFNTFHSYIFIPGDYATKNCKQTILSSILICSHVFRGEFWVKRPSHKKICAWSLNQGAVTPTASSGPILKAVHLIAIFKRKMALVCRKPIRSSVSLFIFLLKIHVLLAALIDLKIQHWMSWCFY